MSPARYPEKVDRRGIGEAYITAADQHLRVVAGSLMSTIVVATLTPVKGHLISPAAAPGEASWDGPSFSARGCC